MYYNYLLPQISLSLKKLSFSTFQNGMNTEYDPHLTPVNYSRRTYNFNFQNGALKTGLGISDLNIPYNQYYANLTKTLLQPTGLQVYGSWLYYYYDQASERYEATLFIYCSDKKFYFNVLNSSMSNFVTIGDFTMEEVPNVLNYKLNGKDVLILTSKTDGMYVFDFDTFEPLPVLDAPNIMSMCIHYERLFATVSGSRSEVWFSDDLDPTNWSVSLNEAGFIQMADERGPMNKVISLNDYVYVFREYGISRITALGNQQDFSVTQLYFSNSKIYEKTVCACGNNIFFLAKDGLYVFNGLTATKLDLKFENMLQAGEKSVGCFHNGKYYLATRMNFNDGKVIQSEAYDTAEVINNNVVIELDTESGEVSLLRGVNITAMTSINHALFSKLVVVVQNGTTAKLGQLDSTGQLFGTPTPKFWLSPETDLGYATDMKILKQLFVSNREPFTFTVTTEKQTKSWQVPKTTSVSKVNLNLKGTVFSFTFSTDQAQAAISNPQITFGVL